MRCRPLASIPLDKQAAWRHPSLSRCTRYQGWPLGLAVVVVAVVAVAAVVVVNFEPLR